MRRIRIRRRAVAAFLVLTGLLLALPALAQAPAAPPEGWYWHHHGDFGWGHIVFGTLMMIVFWGGLILLVVLGVRWLGRGSPGPAEHTSGSKMAVRILEERFARGEIGKDEFEERKRLLSE